MLNVVGFWCSLLKSSVRVFFAQCNGAKNVSRTLSKKTSRYDFKTASRSF